ncbi:metal ABC transporter solute-binding protein, Zn/Mn family [Neobacillus sp. NPDC093182]|uniref:metal ABC transporter solute-binding protein, Zn/Mn family n=1 Tax=Neobacillus sp. NPDC093182 TaxID=3364297 RepID=UPI00381E27B5
MKMKHLVSTSILMFSLMLSGCGKSETVSENTDKKEKETLTVYTTIYPLEDFTKKIGGEFVEVQSIYPPSVDAHSYEPTTKDMINLADSDLFIYTGVGIEGFADKAAETLQKEEVQILKAGEGIELIPSSDEHHHEGEEGHSESEHHEDEEGHSEGEAESHEHEEDEHHHGDLDPHVWLDPVLAVDVANNIKTSLSKIMPEHKAEFETNFNKLKSELEQLDQEFKTTIDASKTKYLLVAHAAYGYWEKRYGIKQIAIAGLSPTQEPSQKELQAIIEESSEHNIHYVVFEQNLTPKVAKIIQDEIGAKSLTLHNLEAVTKENLKQKDDYFSIMRKNLETLKIALNE